MAKSDGFCPNHWHATAQNAAQRGAVADVQQNFRAQGRQSPGDAGDPAGSGASRLTVAGIEKPWVIALAAIVVLALLWLVI